MSDQQNSTSHGQSVAARFRERGAFGGFLAGLAVGAVVCAPQVRAWPISSLAPAFLGSIGLGTLIGYLAGPLFIGNVARGDGSLPGGCPGDIYHPTDSGYGSGHDSGSGDGGHGGGDH